MALQDPSHPQPSLEGGRYKPSTAGGAPIVNAVDVNTLPNKNQNGQKEIPENVSDLIEFKIDELSPKDTADWVGMARNAYEASESWITINQRAIWSRSLAHYQSQHSSSAKIPPHRAKHFFPKTRTLVKKIQAAVASAYFSNADVVDLQAEDNGDLIQAEAASLMKELVNYRLTQTIPWFKTVIGAATEAAVIGTVVSHQSWEYEERDAVVKENKLEGTDQVEQYFETVVEIDRPKIRLVPAENIRMSSASDWVDPANSSPYLIELIPMYIGDVKAKIAKQKKRVGEKSSMGEPDWFDVSESVLLSSVSRAGTDNTRRARAGSSKQDPKETTEESENNFKTAWIHRNIVKYEGEDWLYYTAGTQTLLSEPVKLRDVLPWAEGKRDYVIGSMEIETDKPYPTSPVELVSGMQKAVNELKNQGYDAVRQTLNPRYLYKQGATVDRAALVRNVPGGIIGVAANGNLSEHVQALNPPSVPPARFEEEDRLTLAFDDLAGSTTGATVQANRRLSETVGGMEMMAEGANEVRELELSVFKESWMEPVLRQLVQLEAMFETDTVALTVAARKAKLNKVLAVYFSGRFSVAVNVGLGATTPTQRMQRIQTAVGTIGQMIPEAANALNVGEVVKEVFGAAGFQDGNRFFNEQLLKDTVLNRQKTQLLEQKAQEQQLAMGQQQMDQAAQPQEEEEANPQAEAMLQLNQLKAKELEHKVAMETAKQQLEQAKIQLKMQEQQAKYELEKAKLQLAQAEMQFKGEKVRAEVALDKIEAVYKGAQTSGVVASNPKLAPAIDKLVAGAVSTEKPSVVGTPAVATPVNTPKEASRKEYMETGGTGQAEGIETQKIEEL